MGLGAQLDVRVKRGVKYNFQVFHVNNLIDVGK